MQMGAWKRAVKVQDDLHGRIQFYFFIKER